MEIQFITIFPQQQKFYSFSKNEQLPIYQLSDWWFIWL